MFFPPSIQPQQLPVCAEVLNTQCPLPAGSVAQLLCHTRRGHLDLPLDASLGCKTMAWSCLVLQTENEHLHGVRRELVLVGGECALSPCLSPGVTGALLQSKSFRRGEAYKWLPVGFSGYCRDEEGLWMDSGSQGSQPKGKTV